MPKKYYVHNDIFRYQDDVFPEENSDETAEGTVGKNTDTCTLHLSLGVLLISQTNNSPDMYVCM